MNSHKIRHLLLVFLFPIFVFHSAAWGAASPPATAAPEAAAAAETAASLEGEDPLYSPRTLDGAVVEAVEAYPNPSKSSLGLGLGIYPLSGYYSAFLLNLNYLSRINRNYQWEILNVNYAYTFDKDLTVELADRFNVAPQRIDRLQFLVSSNVLRVLTHGKFIFMDDHIRYFQTSFVGGLGLAKTTAKMDFLVNVGFRAEIFTSEKFSWRFDVRDGIVAKGFNQFVNFMLSTGYAF